MNISGEPSSQAAWRSASHQDRGVKRSAHLKDRTHINPPQVSLVANHLTAGDLLSVHTVKVPAVGTKWDAIGGSERIGGGLSPTTVAPMPGNGAAAGWIGHKKKGPTGP